MNGQMSAFTHPPPPTPTHTHVVGKCPRSCSKGVQTSGGQLSGGHVSSGRLFASQLNMYYPPLNALVSDLSAPRMQTLLTYSS